MSTKEEQRIIDQSLIEEAFKNAFPQLQQQKYLIKNLQIFHYHDIATLNNPEKKIPAGSSICFLKQIANNLLFVGWKENDWYEKGKFNWIGGKCNISEPQNPKYDANAVEGAIRETYEESARKLTKDMIKTHLICVNQEPIYLYMRKSYVFFAHFPDSISVDEMNQHLQSTKTNPDYPEEEKEIDEMQFFKISDLYKTPNETEFNPQNPPNEPPHINYNYYTQKVKRGAFEFDNYFLKQKLHPIDEKTGEYQEKSQTQDITSFVIETLLKTFDK